MREPIVVPSIRSRQVARSQRSGVRSGKDALEALNFGNGLLRVHSVTISIMNVATVKPKDAPIGEVRFERESIDRSCPRTIPRTDQFGTVWELKLNHTLPESP
jgi:hypothetical protein